jgi:hypothetical protein
MDQEVATATRGRVQLVIFKFILKMEKIEEIRE